MGRTLSAVTAIIGKDLRLFGRDRFYVLITVLGLGMFGGLFWLLPADVEEDIPIGIHLPGAEALFEAELGARGLDEATQEGLAVDLFASASQLEEAVALGDTLHAGLDFPEGFLEAAAAGQPTTVRVLLAGDAPHALRPALTAAVREIAATLGGDQPPVTLPDLDEMVVGTDRAGDPVSLREQMRPLLVFLVLLMEMFALASLVAVEIAQRTATAVLATPTRVGQLLAAKALLGTALAFGQGLVIAAVTGALAQAPGLVAAALLLGAVLVTGFGLLAGATGQDFVAIVFWSMLLFVPLAIPAFAVLFPGSTALWIQALPSHGFVEVLVGTTIDGEGWAQAWPNLALLAAWGVAAFVAGTAVLAGRIRRA